MITSDGSRFLHDTKKPYLSSLCVWKKMASLLTSIRYMGLGQFEGRVRITSVLFPGIEEQDEHLMRKRRRLWRCRRPNLCPGRRASRDPGTRGNRAYDRS